MNLPELPPFYSKLLDRVIELAKQANIFEKELLPDNAWRQDVVRGLQHFYELAIADYIKRVGEPVLGRAEREFEERRDL